MPVYTNHKLKVNEKPNSIETIKEIYQDTKIQSKEINAKQKKLRKQYQVFSNRKL